VSRAAFPQAALDLIPGAPAVGGDVAIPLIEDGLNLPPLRFIDRAIRWT
jgi:hypothetical protein